MTFQERNYHLLIVSSSPSFNEGMREILADFRCFTVQFMTNVAAAKRMVLEKVFDFVLINTPLPDDFGTRFAIEFSLGKSGVSLLLVKGEIYEEVYRKVLDYGVYVLPKPLNRYVMTRGLEWMCTTRERMRKVEKKTLSMEEKMAEIRLVNHAKWVLIEHLNMKESDAHRYIEKQAMDHCVSRKEIAENILKTYS